MMQFNFLDWNASKYFLIKCDDFISFCLSVIWKPNKNPKKFTVRKFRKISGGFGGVCVICCLLDHLLYVSSAKQIQEVQEDLEP